MLEMLTVRDCNPKSLSRDLQLLSRVFDSLPAAVACVDLRSRIVDCNPGDLRYVRLPAGGTSWL